MTMGDNIKSLHAKMIIDVIIGPVLERLEKRDPAVSQTLRSAIMKADSALPGFTFDFLRGIMKKAEIADQFDMGETLLRLGGSPEIYDELRINRPEKAFQELNRCAEYLKKILGRIPEQITDRKQFLETIKEIANAIRLLLDAINGVSTLLPDNGSKQLMEEKKKDFVRFSKKFSNTLKEFFKDTNQNQSVFLSANSLINQTNLILRTVKECL
ncbi:hypothetical protein ACJMK2_017523 [Sinanodonta woodiana]|uniref:Programmed cell death protein 10 dimerisation domain-containing protein n=1 Tax=Sinanodonta woodiana TaxID=1069815 RepID=A0ABD3UAL1_SINWO